MKVKRTVEVSERVAKPRKSGGRTRLWAYGYGDLAVLLGVPEYAVRRWVAAGKDVQDLLQHVHG